MIKTLKTVLTVAVCTFALTANATAHEIDAPAESTSAFPEYTTEAAGANFDEAKIAELEARMSQFVTDGDVRGISTLLVRDGKVISHMQAGIRRGVDNAPITEDTLYRIYSMSKPITGVALMQLWEQGKFSLDDPVSKFIPEFSDLQAVKSHDEEGNFELEPLERQPTMRELMSHTAGFAYGLPNGGNHPSDKAFREKKILASPDLETFIDRVASVPLMQQPGKKWVYSASVDIQGAIVERLSGMTFGEYLQANLFEPMGMEDTAFAVSAEKYDRLSDVFGANPVTKELSPLPFPPFAFKPETVGMESGGGGLVATLADYARFCEMLANGGELNGNRILKPETVKLMRTDVLTKDQKVSLSGNLSEASMQTLGFGLDFGIVLNDGSGKTVSGDGTYFWGGAAGTWFWIDPTNDLYFIGMIQRFAAGGPDFRGVSRELVYDALNEE